MPHFRAQVNHWTKMVSNKQDKPLSKTKKVRCGYCNDEMMDQNLKPHCRDMHQSSIKYAAGDSHITSYFTTNKKRKVPVWKLW